MGKTLKELEKLAQMCRKRGVSELKVTENNVEMKFWDHIPEQPRRARGTKEPSTTETKAVEGMPTEEEILFWSSAGAN